MYNEVEREEFAKMYVSGTQGKIFGFNGSPSKATQKVNRNKKGERTPSKLYQWISNLF
jgi:hypothetical protein